MTADAIFRASSLTKPIVTAAFLSLVEDEVDGPGRPGDPLAARLPAQVAGQVPTITLRQLLTHTAGLSYGFMQPNDGPYLQLGVSDGMDQPGLGFPEELERITEAGLFFPPGAAWLYSVGLDVLGAAMRRPPASRWGRVGGRAGHRQARHGRHRLRRRRSPPAGGRLRRRHAAGEDGRDPHVPFAELSGIKFAPERINTPGSFPSGGAGAACSAPDFLTFLSHPHRRPRPSSARPPPAP
jgi:CubicO group peptidase (beta-lactamase class C family)